MSNRFCQKTIKKKKKKCERYQKNETICTFYLLFLSSGWSFCFLVMSWYIIEDKAKADLIIAENAGDNEPIVDNDELSTIQEEGHENA